MQSTDSMQSPSNDQWHFFTELEQKSSHFMETRKAPNHQSSLEKEEWGWLEESIFLILDHTTKI